MYKITKKRERVVSSSSIVFVVRWPLFSIEYYLCTAVATIAYWDELKNFVQFDEPDLATHYSKIDEIRVRSELLCAAFLYTIWFRPLWNNFEMMNYGDFCSFILDMETKIKEILSKKTNILREYIFERIYCSSQISIPSFWEWNFWQTTTSLFVENWN